MKRQLRFFDILCLGVNAIVGSGIFLIPGRLVGGVGPASIFLFALCGILLITVGLCFAEASSRIDRNGGPYNYVRVAFGDRAGFAMGWIAVVTALFSYAAVANGLPEYLGAFIPGIDQGWKAHAVTTGVIVILTALNIRGVRLGATTTNIFTVGKLVPLAILCVAGLFAVKSSNFVPMAPHGFNPMFGLLLAVVFTYQGFEVAPVPAGETADAKRIVPKATVGSLLLSIVLYMWVQSVVVGSGAAVVGSERPLADAAGAILGPWGMTLISIGAVVSMFGYCAGMAFGAPRYLTVLCEDGFLPQAGNKMHAKFNTPYIAIIAYSIVTLFFTYCLDFNSLVDISAVAVVLQYLFTCASVPALRKKIPGDKNTYTAPGGLLFPILGILTSFVFIVQIKLPELTWSLTTIAVGFIFSWIYRLVAKRGVISPQTL